MNDITQRRLKYRAKTVDATAFANTKARVYYNAKHTSLLLNSDNKIYLRLNYDYQLSRNSNRKLLSQRCDLFLVKRKVERLTYELKISKNWKFHSMIFVAQLKSYSLIENFYSRFRSNLLDFVKIEDDISQWKSWEVERIVDKRFWKYDKKQMTQYQIHWKRYNLEHDVWRSITKLDNCMNLIEKYETRIRVEQKFRDNHRLLSKDRRSQSLSTNVSMFTIEASRSDTSVVSTLEHLIILISRSRFISSTSIESSDASLRRTSRLQEH